MNATPATMHTPPARGWTPRTDCQLRDAARDLLLGALASLALLIPGGWMIYSDAAAERDARAARAERMLAHERLMKGPPAALLPVDAAARGRDQFLATCAACHRPDGTGVPGLGKDLTRSWFVAASDDEAMARFVATGRSPLDPENSTRMLMPARGGQAALSDEALRDIVLYMRGLQDPRIMPALPPPTAVAAAPATEAEKAAALAAAGGDAELAEYIAHGGTLFATSCTACHGKDARGVPGQGKDLVTSAFCRGLDDDALLAFLKKGRSPNDPLNTTKVDMPPKGGNPALSDDDLLDIICYLRSLQGPVASNQ